MTLNTDAVRKALIQYLQTDLNMNVSNKTIDVTVVVGRKSADKPVPDITATVNISDMEATIGNVGSETPLVDKQFTPVETGNSLIEATEEEPLDELEVVMPAETPESELGQSAPNNDVNPFEEIEEEVSQPATSGSMFGN
jgi:hypothetical protein